MLPAQSDVTINELTMFSLTNTAADSDVPANILTYVLIDPPAGMTIDTNGIISWTPGESQGPSTNLITTAVTDDGAPPLTITNTFMVTVLEVNSAPSLPLLPDRAIVGMQPLSVTNAATDLDIPRNALAYSLIASPTNATIDNQGVIAWTPLISQVPSTNVFRTTVTDDGIPPLTATNEFIVVVEEIHNGPVLPVLPDLTADANAPIVVTNTAADADVPAWPLHYRLLSAPEGASIDEAGVIRWTASELQAPSTNMIITTVSDHPAPGDGAPLSSTNQFTIVIERLPAQPPLIQSITVSNQVAVLSWTTVAGYNYRLQYSDDLAQTNWSDSGFEALATASSMAGSNDVTEVPQRYFRVILTR